MTTDILKLLFCCETSQSETIPHNTYPGDSRASLFWHTTELIVNTAHQLIWKKVATAGSYSNQHFAGSGGASVRAEMGSKARGCS